ncbi:sugar transferase [Lactococcus cremoris]|nr:sugar transferase [Lactococcus cremoris]
MNALQKENINAGSKAVNDATEIFEKMGYESLLSKVNIKNIYLRTLFFSVQVMIRILFLPKNTKVVSNFPPIFFFERICLYFLKKRSKSLKVFILIHDIYELRIGKNNSTPYRNLLNFKNSNFYFIAHNDKMVSWLVKEGYKKNNIIDLEIFDYLSVIKEDAGGTYGKSVIIAGNLAPEKSSYLMELFKISEIDFNLYGPNVSSDVEKSKNVIYHGSFPADEIPNIIQGSYGLIWDSETTIGGTGKYGNYQRYNNPHKTSLYLAAGFPIIMWEKAALASFIMEHNLGFLVNTLEEIPSKIAKIKEVDYNRMRENVEKFGNKIRMGYFLTEALEKAEEISNE